MIDVRRAVGRGRGGEAGVESWHAFSFGAHYDPDNLRFGAMIACNEERLEPGAGFDWHGHSHTEIVTWVVEGELTHLDSTGHETRVRPGDVQRLTSATGVRHVERNDADTPLTFLQTWLVPSASGREPGYEVVRDLADATPYAVPEAGATLHVRRLEAGERTLVPVGRYGYLHVVRGAVLVAGEELGAGDSARVTEREGPLEVAAAGTRPVELVMWEMSGSPGDDATTARPAQRP